MSATRPMTVANIAFLLDRLAADTPPNQQIRELTENALEAIQRRMQSGDASDGLVKWDVDWEHLRRTGQYKLCVIDNGDGMTAEQMAKYLNSLAVQGANQTQSISQNFGVGAKITALYRNRFGLVYQSWREGRGAMVRLHRDDRIGEYGLSAIDLPDGPHYTPRIKNTVRPRGIEDSGTKVTLLGASKDDNTCLPPQDVGGMNWLVRYLTSRYFRLPENVKLQVRVLTKDTERWPTEEPIPSEKTFNLQTIHPMKQLLDDYSSDRGTVRLTTADAHWWLFADPMKDSKDMSTRGVRTGQVGIVFQDEVYVQRVSPASRRILASFGIVFGAEHVVIYVEPRHQGTIDVRADTARSRVIINGEDFEEANWWETWGTEFKEQMPLSIKELIDRIMARSNSDPEGKTRNRILERLKRLRELLRPTRYRRTNFGNVFAMGETTGGGSQDTDAPAIRDTGAGGSGKRGGRVSDDYLADLVESGGEPAAEVLAKPKEPIVHGVSRAEGTRGDDELEDVAAEIVGDPATGDMIKVNADFRGYLDMVEHFGREFNPNGTPDIQMLIIEYVREWMELQLIEAVVTVRNLVNGRTWTSQELQQALSSKALTTLLMSRFHVFERVKRDLQTYVSRAGSRVA